MPRVDATTAARVGLLVLARELTECALDAAAWGDARHPAATIARARLRHARRNHRVMADWLRDVETGGAILSR